MNAPCSAFALGCLLAASAQAQLLPDPAPASPAQLERNKALKTDPFAGSHQPYPRIYGGNVAAQPNDHVFKDMRRDPQLLAGAEVAPNVSIEGGHMRLPDRGLHRVEPGKPEDAAIALGEPGSSNYLAAKYALPASEGLSAYGKLGIAHSQTRSAGASASDTGRFTGAGAQLKLDKATTVNGEFKRYGDAAKKLAPLSNDSLKANLKLGF
jgi:hypothetical protein